MGPNVLGPKMFGPKRDAGFLKTHCIQMIRQNFVLIWFENYQFGYLLFMSSLHIGRLIGTSEGKNVAEFLLYATLS